MEMKLLSKKEDLVRVVVKDTHVAMMNTLRRLVVNKVPTMAIDTVEIVENSSGMYDEMLAHRLGLVVLKTDLDSYFVKEKCKCKDAGCARCTLDLTLEMEGPCTVYAKDLQSKDPAVVPVHGDTPLTLLLEGQKLKLHAKAVVGLGKEHVKFSSGLLYYQGYPQIKVGNVKNPKGVASVCPTNVFSASGKLKVENLDACTLCMACADVDEAVQVSGAKDAFILSIEPWGQLSALAMVEQAMLVIQEDVDALAAAVEKA